MLVYKLEANRVVKDADVEDYCLLPVSRYVQALLQLSQSQTTVC